MQFEYEDQLPFEDFALRLPQHMVYMLPQLLHELLDNERDKVRSCSLLLNCPLQLLCLQPTSAQHVSPELCSPGGACVPLPLQAAGISMPSPAGCTITAKRPASLRSQAEQAPVHAS